MSGTRQCAAENRSALEHPVPSHWLVRNFYYDELTRSSRTSFPPLASLPFTGLLVRTFRRAHLLAARHRGRMATARLFHTLRACAPRADLAVHSKSDMLSLTYVHPVNTQSG